MDKLETLQKLQQNISCDIERIKADEQYNPGFNWYAEMCIKADLGNNDLKNLLETCRKELEQDYEDYKKENPEDTFDDYYQHQGADRVREIADSNTPVYNATIDNLYYLYGAELDEAYENAGLYTEKPENYKAVCIVLYLEQELYEYMRELESLHED